MQVRAEEWESSEGRERCELGRVKVGNKGGEEDTGEKEG